MDNNYYLTFTAGFSVEQAKAIFQKKFGQQPDKCFLDGQLLKVGPIPRRGASPATLGLG